MTAGVLRYDAACHAIAEAKTVDEVREWIDKAAAIREYGRRIKNRKMELDAVEIRVQAKRRRGELLREMRDDGRLYEGKRKQSAPADSLTLADLDVSRDESSEEQALASIDGDSFSRLMARCRAYAEAHPEKHSINPLKPPPEGPINGARALMGSRQESADSLDYFPTPPWATRALFEQVLPAIGNPHIASAWEPACGEGHIAQVLNEYVALVRATDIFDYGYGDAVMDFLDPATRLSPFADFIITNPPFGDKAVAFVLKALEHASVGVAMFFRLQWIPTKGRYESLFRDKPPTLVAFFTERVPIIKGEWDPTASTATDYIWLIWLHGEQPKPPFWIPPGQREALTRPDDAKRFTAHPVIKRGALPPHDPETGEIISEAAE